MEKETPRKGLKRIVLIGMTALFLTMTGCMQQIMEEVVKNLEFSLVGVEVPDMDANALAAYGIQALGEAAGLSTGAKNSNPLGITLVLTARNTNPFSARISGMDYGFKINGRNIFAGGFEEDMAINLDQGANALVQLPLGISLPELIGLIGNLGRSEDMDYSIGGTIVLDTKFGKIPFPLNLKGQGVPFLEK